MNKTKRKERVFYTVTESHVKEELEQYGITPETVGKEKYKEVFGKVAIRLEKIIKNSDFNPVAQAVEEVLDNNPELHNNPELIKVGF